MAAILDIRSVPNLQFLRHRTQVMLHVKFEKRMSSSFIEDYYMEEYYIFIEEYRRCLNICCFFLGVDRLRTIQYLTWHFGPGELTKTSHLFRAPDKT